MACPRRSRGCRSTGTHTIEAYEAPGTAPKALKIQRGPASAQAFFFVELRTPAGFDSHLPSIGVFVHSASDNDSNSSYLLDMTPETQFGWYYEFLAVGKSFTDPVSGVTIQTVSANSTSATIAVTMGGVPPFAVDPDRPRGGGPQLTWTPGTPTRRPASWSSAPLARRPPSRRLRPRQLRTTWMRVGSPGSAIACVPRTRRARRGRPTWPVRRRHPRLLLACHADDHYEFAHRPGDDVWWDAHRLHKPVRDDRRHRCCGEVHRGRQDPQDVDGQGRRACSRGRTRSRSRRARSPCPVVHGAEMKEERSLTGPTTSARSGPSSPGLEIAARARPAGAGAFF